MCVEINAHSLLAFIFILRDKFQADSECFLPLMLGSQSCERVFRSLRSMTGTFSTVVIFSMLGMLQRLHKLHIQIECQSKSENASGICFPRQERYGRRKDGSKTHSSYSLDISNENIYKCMKKSEKRAQDSMERLGMVDELKKLNVWTIPPVPPHILDHTQSDEDDDDDDDDGETIEKNSDYESVEDPFTSSSDNIPNLMEDINHLYINKAIDITVKTKADKIRQALPFKKTDKQDIGIPVYTKSNDQLSEIQRSSFVEVDILGKENIYIRKRTAVWLLQDTERLSADRLFRVRAKQPFSEKKLYHKNLCDIEQRLPVVAEYVVIGDLCAFNLESKKISIGRVLQFIKYDNKNKELP